MYAIKAWGIGLPPQFRNVGNNPLPAGFDFLVEEDPTGKVVSEDGMSLRNKTTTELAAEALENLRQRKLQDLKAEALRRFQIVNSELDTWGMIELLYIIWTSVAPAARSPTIDMQNLIDIYTVAKSSYTWLMNPARTYAELEAADPINDPAWP